MYEIKSFAKKHHLGITLSLLLGGSLLMLWITGNKVALKPKEISMSVLYVFQSTVNGVDEFFSNIFNSIERLRKMQVELEELQGRLTEYQGMERNVADLKDENNRLREQLDLVKTVEYKNIPAKIIGADPGNLFTSLTINKGSRDGLKRDMPVVAFNNGFQGLVGRITNVGLFSATIMPIYDSASYVGVRMKSSRYLGLMNGTGRYQDTLIVQDMEKRAYEDIELGDLVVTSEASTIFPAGLYVGRVRTKKIKYQFNLELTVEPIIDFSKIEFVYVLASKGKKVK